jgi:alpha-ketoglutarate-dependent taurine dioxygenase
LALNSESIKNDVAKFGAVLLRGFEIHSAREFEKAILSIRGFRPMGEQFMHDAGRIGIRGTTHVVSTHSVNPTGGAFSIGGGWHTEGYHHPDVPHYLIFNCRRPSWLGGETALAFLPSVYDALPERTQEKLAKYAIVTSAWPVSVVAKKYKVAEERVEAFCAETGLTLDRSEAGKHVVLTKPSVLRHPLVGSYSLSANFGWALPKLRRKTWRYFLPLYDGWQWSLHRFAWSRPRLRLLLNVIGSILWSVLAHPRTAVEYFGSASEQRASRKVKLGDRFHRLRDMLEEGDVEILANALWKQSSIFHWKRGDILIIDNVQVAHCGMPGLGPRTLHVMMCNPLPLHQPISSGLVELSRNEADKNQSVSSHVTKFLLGNKKAAFGKL